MCNLILDAIVARLRAVKVKTTTMGSGSYVLGDCDHRSAKEQDLTVNAATIDLMRAQEKYFYFHALIGYNRQSATHYEISQKSSGKNGITAIPSFFRLTKNTPKIIYRKK